jgi:phosphoribosylamine--glycine ligase
VRVLVVGGGGREHCIVWSLARGSSTTSIIAAPGNPGIGQIAECHDVQADDIDGLVDLAAKTQTDLVVVGPEVPLVAGLADVLIEKGFKVFGPRAAGARLEGSKSFAKSLMIKAGIPTAKAKRFSDLKEAMAYLDTIDGSAVVKADGLAGGKGVVVCDGAEEAREALLAIMKERRFGEAGAEVLIEERMFGPELSVLAFSDGKSVVTMPGAQDFKQAHDYDKGPNTGGMGSYSPVERCTPQVFEAVIDTIIEPVAAALAREVEPYIGVIYAGLMLTDAGPKVVEFNCRFGDPETQALLPRFESDLGEIMMACVDGSLAGAHIEWSPDACVSVVAASRGYPEADRIPGGFEVRGIDEAEKLTGIPVFQAGTVMKNGKLVTNGGRILAVSAKAESVPLAREKAYAAISHIDFHGMWFRSDIASGNRGVNLVDEEEG